LTARWAKEEPKEERLMMPAAAAAATAALEVCRDDGIGEELSGDSGGECNPALQVLRDCSALSPVKSNLRVNHVGSLGG